MIYARLIAIALAIAVPAAPALAAPVAKPACAHAAVVAKARDVFERCSTGPARAQDLGDMDGALNRVKNAIASTCATQ
jgi:hypothetical protein